MNTLSKKIIGYALIIGLSLFVAVLVLFISVQYVSFLRAVIVLFMFISFWIGGGLWINTRNLISVNKNTWLYFAFDNLMLLFRNPYSDDKQITSRIRLLRLNALLFFGLWLLFLALA